MRHQLRDVLGGDQRTVSDLRSLYHLYVVRRAAEAHAAQASHATAVFPA
nr:MAG TPA: hypothetical protein [Caudoviricetes sp.]